MRTKALLVGAIIGAASLASSMAQVYSVNIVGYINVPIKPGWNLIANQLDNSAGNTVGTLIPNPPQTISVYTYDAAGQTYNNANWDPRFGWDDDTITIAPGQGAFINNATIAGPGPEFTMTFVGQVMTGTQTINWVVGWQLVAPVVPQEGLLQTDLGFTPSATPQGDSIYTYNAATQSYNNYNWEPRFGWDEEPTMLVGQGMFVLRTATGQWTRTFNVSGN